MARNKDVKNMIRRVNLTMDKLEKLLGNDKIPERNIEVEKDRVAYKEGIVDGICMYSWRKAEESGDDTDYVGSPTATMKLSDVLEEIGSVFGFDGKEQLERVKMIEKVVTANEKVKVLDDGVKSDTKVTDMKGEDIEVKDKE